MNLPTVDQVSLADALNALREEVSRLGQRIAALEQASGAKPAAAVLVPAAPSPAQDEALSDELIHVIGAAVAAFLGVKPHIRQIRLLTGRSWAQQGRVTIQASHALSIRHD